MQPWYWAVIIGVLAIFYFLLIARQKKQEKQNLEMLNSFRVGDKVVTHIGVYGRIKRIHNTTYGKVCTLEIGTTNKIDIEIDLRYIAGIDEKTAVPEDTKTETNKDEEKQEQNKPKEDIKEIIHKENTKKNNKE